MAFFLGKGDDLAFQMRQLAVMGGLITSTLLTLVVPISIDLIIIMLFSGLGTIRSALKVFANLPFALAKRHLRLGRSVTPIPGSQSGF